MVDYPLFQSSFEAQSLGGLLPIIRAHRPKLPHPVYDILNYRMRNAADHGRPSPATRFG
jgi:hypothetical protein